MFGDFGVEVLQYASFPIFLYYKYEFMTVDYLKNRDYNKEH